MSRLITAKDVARRDGFINARDRVIRASARMVERGLIPQAWTGLTVGNPIPARIDFGRWIADCPYCRGAEYVDPDEPFLFCFSCGMAAGGGIARPVIFPPDIDEIESLLLDRPIDDSRGADKVSKAFLSIPVIPGLGRSWFPGETTDDLKKQNKAINKGGG